MAGRNGHSSPLHYSASMAEKLAFGPPWNPLSTDRKVADALGNGRLELPPHPVWTLPETINWAANPFGEANWVAQFHMLRWIDPLRRQAESGRLHLLDTWERIALSWIQDNPPGRGRASYSWADMVEAARAITFCLALPLLEKHRPDVVPTVLHSIDEHGEWLADASHIRTGNHALQQHQGLLVIGAVMRRDDWVDLAIERSRAMVRSSYDEQGINEEGAIQYHQINYSWWNTLGRRIATIRGSVPEEFDVVGSAPVAMAHATRPDGNYELIGDTEIFSPRGVRHPATEYIASNGESGAAPRQRAIVYDSGYVFCRSTWGDSTTRFSDADFVSLRFGPQNRIHGHADGMALTLFHDGESLLVDSGKFAYDAKDPYRAHLLSREAHNSISVEGLDYDKAKTVELVHHRLDEWVHHCRFADSGYRGVGLTRDVLVCFSEQLIIVIDSFTADSEVTVRQHWHLNPEAGHRKEAESVKVVMPRTQLQLAFEGHSDIAVVKGHEDPPQGWYSPSWRKKIANRTVTASTSGRSGRIFTVIDYGGATKPLTIEAVESTGTVVQDYRIVRDEQAMTVSTGPDWAALAMGRRDGALIQQLIDAEVQ